MATLLNEISTAAITSEVILDGQKISSASGVISITVERLYNKIASAQVILMDGNVERADFAMSNQSYTLPGKTLEVRCGYNGDIQSIFKGVLVSHAIKVRAGKSQLVLYAKDKAIALALTKKNDYFLNTRDSDIISGMLTGAGLVPDVEATATLHGQVVQAQASAWDFIVQRAEANGMLVSTEGDTVSVKKPSFTNLSTVVAAYGKNVYEFDGDIDARHQLPNVTSKGLKYEDQTLLSKAGSEPKLPVQGNINGKTLADSLGVEPHVQLHGGISNENELSDWADAQLLKSRLAKTIGRVKISGTYVGLGQTITLKGLGDRFNGQVLVTGTRHEIVRGGWWVDLQFGLTPKWHSQELDTSYNEISNLLPSIQGLHVGVITALEGDPESNERVKVRLLFVKEADEGIWARVATLDAGANRGTVVLPEVGDEVIVGFIQNDPRFAVVLGMMHSKGKARPKDLQAKDDNHLKGWVSRSGLKFILDDEKKILTLSTPNNNTIVMEGDGKKIEIKDASGNMILMSDAGIEINSAKDLILKASNDVKIEGINIKQEASAEWTSKGSAAAKVESTATTTVKGAMVMIN